MSEPTVKIPVRLALRAARHLHHIGHTFSSLGEKNGARICKEISADFQKQVVDQCSLEDLRIAAVALELQEHA